jgi:dienelactone hydrolase
MGADAHAHRWAPILVRMSSLLAAVTVLMGLGGCQTTVERPASASPTVRGSDDVVTISFRDFEGVRRQVAGVLSRPGEPVAQQRPAVVILHDGGGWQTGRTRMYAEFFRAQGLIVLEPRLYQHSGQSDLYRDLPAVLGALEHLAGRPEVDSRRIYLLGMSAGAMLAMLANSEWPRRTLGIDAPRFRAHAAFYPVCWIFQDGLQSGRNPYLGKLPAETFARWGSTPVRLFVPELDDYDDRDPATCERFVAALPAEHGRAAFSVQRYPGATHGWDHGQTYSFFARSACKGRGCTNTNRSDPQTTRQAREDLLKFFVANGL